MKQLLLPYVLPLIGFVNRLINPIANHKNILTSTNPLSRKFGIDRGTPIDRYYIDKFIQENGAFIKGRCLEIDDNRYTTKYGTGVVVSDVLDVVETNRNANIIGDLRHVPQIKSDTYDCIILTQVLGMIDDLDATISELHRILKKGGVLLITTSALSPCVSYDLSFWRFTVPSLRYILTKKFDKKDISVTSYGNALTSQLFYIGGVQEDITPEQLNVNDRVFPTLIVAKGVKS